MEKLKIGVIVIAHGKLATDLVKTAEYIAGENPDVVAINVEKNMTIHEIKEKIEEGIKQVNKGEGVLILTDMFGGTPSNVSLSFIKKKQVEVITGVNLPMLLKIFTVQEFQGNLQEFAEYIKSYGQKNILRAGEVLKADEKEEK